MFTKEDLEKKYQEENKKQIKQYYEEEELFKTLTYEEWVKNSNKYVYIKSVRQLSSYLYNNATYEELTTIYNELLENVKNFKHGEITVEINQHDEDEVCFCCRCIVLTKTVLNSNIKYKVRIWAESRLKPEGVLSTKPIDCKLLQLFKEGTIDFNTLQTLTYTDCKI